MERYTRQALPDFSVSLLSWIFSKYEVRVKCANCGNLDILWAPKGLTKAEFLKSDAAVCSNCGCSDFETRSVASNKKIGDIPEKIW